MDENSACLLFSRSSGIGPKTFVKVISYFGNAKDAWSKLDSSNAKTAGVGDAAYKKFDLSRKTLDVNNYLEKLKKAKVKVVGYTSEQYPKPLKQLDAPPIVLYCKGNLGLLKSSQNIGVVGARKITGYGRDVTEKLVNELTSCGFVIVSGLAFGVDAVAHKTALENQGKTIAVLGCGVDCPYPQENQDLYEKILDSENLIVSEYPLGMPPSPGSFPARNRIIAALSLGVLVTEAAEDSGSLITAEEARKLEKPVFAVPGSIQAQMSRGTLKLLKEGAKLVMSGNDIIETLQLKTQNAKGKSTSQNGHSVLFSQAQKLKLNAKEKGIVEILEREEMPLDLLSKETGIPMVKLMVLVSGLEMRGIVSTSGGNVTLVIDK